MKAPQEESRCLVCESVICPNELELGGDQRGVVVGQIGHLFIWLASSRATWNRAVWPVSRSVLVFCHFLKG